MHDTTFRPIPEPMIRVGALGFALGRNPADKPHNIQPAESLWNAPDGRELTYSQAKDEAWKTPSFLVYYLVTGRYCLDNVYEGDTCRPAVFGTKEAALLFVQERIDGKQSISRQFLLEGPGADYHITNDAEGLKAMQWHLPYSLRSRASV
jgi:hypothetical protein